MHPCKMHAWEIYAREIYACEMHAYEIRLGDTVYLSGVHLIGVYFTGVHFSGGCGRECGNFGFQNFDFDFGILDCGVLSSVHIIIVCRTLSIFLLHISVRAWKRTHSR